MTQIEFFEQQLSATSPSGPLSASAAAILDALEATLTENQDYHRLFDARLIRARRNLQLPITQPTSLSTVPRELDDAFRSAYVAAAREVGTLFLENGRLADAWAYFRTIGEPGPVRTAIEQISTPSERTAEFDEIMNLALYEGAHFVRGLQWLLDSHGTCNTVTAMNQLMSQMSAEERRQAAAMLVRRLTADLQFTVRRDLEARHLQTAPEATLGDLLAGNEWLFDEGNYHIDVSHLHATVGFARHLKPGDPELPMAIDLCTYGSQLAEPLRYPADVPFDDYYPAHRHFLEALDGRNPDASLHYFLSRLETAENPADQRLIAFVVVDLGQRIGRTDQTLDAAGRMLSRMEDPTGFSFAALCIASGRADLLTESAREHDDVLAYATALLSSPRCLN